MNEPQTRKPRRWWIGVFVVILLGVGWLAMRGLNPRSSQAFYKGNALPLNCGHRGASGLGVENTIPSFDAAIKAGAQCVEFDVMLTKDKKVVVFHDHRLEQRLYAEGTVKQMTWAQLQQVDVSDYILQHQPLRSETKSNRPARIPLLRDVFAWFKKHPKVLLNIEIKTNKAKGDGLEEALASLIKEFGYQERVLVSSFNPFALGRFAKLLPSIRRGLIYSEDTAIYLRRLWFARLAKPDALHPNHTMVTPAYMRWAEAKGLPVHVWTVNRREDMRRMLELGVQMIITDFPNRLAEEKAAFQKAAR
ncbi:MAG: hypothetical protein EP343_27760 [Deltaproteobacteria bacterium]|nr:MAG: hypothetical protein EP343_27760 [Deltaproteobacteria bacterium]